jgi:hypothetical protein
MSVIVVNPVSQPVPINVTNATPMPVSVTGSVASPVPVVSMYHPRLNVGGNTGFSFSLIFNSYAQLVGNNITDTYTWGSGPTAYPIPAGIYEVIYRAQISGGFPTTHMFVATTSPVGDGLLASATASLMSVVNPGQAYNSLSAEEFTYTASTASLGTIPLMEFTSTFTSTGGNFGLRYTNICSAATNLSGGITVQLRRIV